MVYFQTELRKACVEGIIYLVYFRLSKSYDVKLLIKLQGFVKIKGDCLQNLTVELEEYVPGSVRSGLGGDTFIRTSMSEQVYNQSCFLPCMYKLDR